MWQACVDQLAQELPEQQFNTWIKPLSAQVSEDQLCVTLFVANRFKLDWIRAQYAGRLASMLESLQGHPVQIELVITPRDGGIRTTRQSTPSSMENGPEPVDLPEELRRVREIPGVGDAEIARMIAYGHAAAFVRT